MELKFSHIDILVNDLEAACTHYARVFSARVSRPFTWQRDGLHVRYAVVLFGSERFILVQPLAGNLLELMQRSGEGTIYRQCYTTPDILVAYDELLAKGEQPEDENGKPLAREQLDSPSGVRIIWLPKRFGQLSIEILQADELEHFIQSAFAISPAEPDRVD